MPALRKQSKCQTHFFGGSLSIRHQNQNPSKSPEILVIASIWCFFVSWLIWWILGYCLPKSWFAVGSYNLHCPLLLVAKMAFANDDSISRNPSGCSCRLVAEWGACDLMQLLRIKMWRCVSKLKICSKNNLIIKSNMWHVSSLNSKTIGISQNPLLELCLFTLSNLLTF